MANFTLKKKINLLGLLGAALSFIGIFHFFIAVIIWVFCFKETIALGDSIDWHMTLPFIQAFMLLLIFILAFTMFVRKIRHGWVVLVVGLCLSATFFIIDIKNKSFQLHRPIQHIGSKYSDITIGYKYDYYNWWWYKEVYILEEELSSVPK